LGPVLKAEEATERMRVTNVRGALLASENASLHPGRLVRGLARAIEKRGGVIYERTEVLNFEGGTTPRFVTPAGEVRANMAIVLARESYFTRLPRLHRVVLPVYSLITLTEPLNEKQWNQIGWQNRESIASCNYTVDISPGPQTEEFCSGAAVRRIVWGRRFLMSRIGMPKLTTAFRN